MRDDAAAVAEQALLGAVLLDPAQLNGAAGRLPATAFDYPQHEAIWIGLHELRESGQIPSQAAPAGRDAWLERVYRHVRAKDGARGTGLGDLHELLAWCPEPSHSRDYAGIVAEHAERRRIGLLARRLATATSNQTVAAIAARIGAAPDGAGEDPPAAARPMFAAGHEAARRQLSSLQLGVRARVEDDLLAALLREGLTGHAAAAGLTVDQFLAPGRAEVYAGILDLHRRRAALDAVTVAAAAEAIGGLTPHAPLAYEQGGPLDRRLTARALVTRVLRPAAPHGRHLLNRFLTRAEAPQAARATATTVAGLAMDPTVPLSELRGRLASAAAAARAASPRSPAPPAARLGR